MSSHLRTGVSVRGPAQGPLPVLLQESVFLLDSEPADRHRIDGLNVLTLQI